MYKIKMSDTKQILAMLNTLYKTSDFCCCAIEALKMLIYD